jgi:outer membrane lipoprotein-sorting protein
VRRAAALAIALALAVPGSGARAAAAAAPTVDQILAQLESSSKDVETLDGEFTQHNRIKLFKKELVSRGRLRFRRPRQIRWEYLEPDPSTLVLDGQRVTLRMPGTAPQVFDLERDATMRAVFEQLLLWLQPGALGRARDDYALTAGGTAEAPTLTLLPKEGSVMGRAFRRVELRLDGKSWLLRGILLVERNGDEKEIAFTRLLRNAKLPGDSFQP